MMEFITDITGPIVPFLIILTILVFVHELGHYVVARICGVRVEVFSIGFGPELMGWTNKRSGTRWKFSLIPLGGYVKMFGDLNAASMPDGSMELAEEEKAYAFPYKTLAQRSWIVAAGPLANFLFAIVLLAGLFTIIGQPFTPAVVDAVLPDSAAEAAGIQSEDRIVAIDDEQIERFEELERIISLSAGKELRIGVERGGETIELVAVPRQTVKEDIFGNKHESGLLGVQSLRMEFTMLPVHVALWRATTQTVSTTGDVLVGVWQIISQQRSFDELGGPIRIAQMSGQVAKIGIATSISFMALLSINLGLINLFPIPILDGGHLLYYGIEAMRGRPLGEKAQEYGFRIGLALVMTLIIAVTWNDFVHLKFVDFVRDLVG
jgi:regulator of sigma E protease